MTSGVKPALPQVLMPKAGAEGKAARNRAPQADFAEALGIGKLSKQLKSGDAMAGRQDVATKPLWQRLAEKFDTAADSPQQTGAKSEAAASSEQHDMKTPIDAGIGGPGRDDDAGKDTPPAAHQHADPVQAATVPAATTPAQIVLKGQAETVPASATADAREERPVAAGAKMDVDDGDPATASAEPIRKQDSAAPVFVPLGRGEKAEPIRFTPASVSTENASADRTSAKDKTPEASSEPAKSAPRVTILAQQSIPAPTPQTSVILAESIAASDLLEPARAPLALDAIHASATHASAQSLKIQLHPAELGMVTATLRFAGEQLSIELQVENHEAYRRLSGDSDAIVSSLRDLGYEIDRVTVLQPTLASTPAGRSEAGASMPSPQGRAPEQFGSGAAGGGNGGSAGRQSGEGSNSDRDNRQSLVTAREQEGSGLYI